MTAGAPKDGPAQTVVAVSETGSTGYEYKLENAIDSFYQADWDTTRLLLSELQRNNGTDLRLHFF